MKDNHSKAAWYDCEKRIWLHYCYGRKPSNPVRDAVKTELRHLLKRKKWRERLRGPQGHTGPMGMSGYDVPKETRDQIKRTIAAMRWWCVMAAVNSVVAAVLIWYMVWVVKF